MFTGIVQGLCPVIDVHEAPNLRRLRIDLGELADGLAPGASVAINGACLTATHIEAGEVVFDVTQETLQASNLSGLAPHSRVNVERSMKAGDEIGGHPLSGHVVDTVLVKAVETAPNRRVLRIEVAQRWLPYLLHKGFVALDGVSLTINAVDRRRCELSVGLIPETIARTTLGHAETGDRLNLEIDAQTQAVVETVTRLLADRETLGVPGLKRGRRLADRAAD